MELGTKEYYINGFKDMLMTNLIANESKSLSSAQSYYEKQIDESYVITEVKKALHLRNLQKAYDEIVLELVGQADE